MLDIQPFILSGEWVCICYIYLYFVCVRRHEILSILEVAFSIMYYPVLLTLQYRANLNWSARLLLFDLYARLNEIPKSLMCVQSSHVYLPLYVSGAMKCKR